MMVKAKSKMLGKWVKLWNAKGLEHSVLCMAMIEIHSWTALDQLMLLGKHQDILIEQSPW